MIAIRKSNAEVTNIDSLNQVSAKGYVSVSLLTQSNDYSKFTLQCYYYTDENDPKTINILSTDNVSFSNSALNAKEDLLGVFAGTNYTDKTIDGCIKIINDFIDTNSCFGLTSGDFVTV